MVSVREPSPLQSSYKIAEGDETCPPVCLSEQSEVLLSIMLDTLVTHADHGLIPLPYV